LLHARAVLEAALGAQDLAAFLRLEPVRTDLAALAPFVRWREAGLAKQATLQFREVFGGDSTTDKALAKRVLGRAFGAKVERAEKNKDRADFQTAVISMEWLADIHRRYRPSDLVE
jgi:hypothetical protein